MKNQMDALIRAGTAVMASKMFQWSSVPIDKGQQRESPSKCKLLPYSAYQMIGLSPTPTHYMYSVLFYDNGLSTNAVFEIGKKNTHQEWLPFGESDR